MNIRGLLAAGRQMLTVAASATELPSDPVTAGIREAAVTTFLDPRNADLHHHFFHNHPSKSCSPSRRDLQATRKIRKMASTLGISMLDHLIFGGQRIYSICQGRML